MHIPHPRRRLVIQAALAAGGLAAWPARAADYPTRPIRVIVNSSPGGLTDVVARLVAARMSQGLGQTLVIENRSGAAVVGIEAIVKAVPDGYTVGVFANAVSTLPAIMPNLPFNPLRDLLPVALLNTAPLVLVTSPESRYRSLQDYLADARARPGQIAFASGGTGTMGHLLGEQLQASARVSLVHVPYKGGGPAMSDILAGHVPVFFDTIGTTMPLARQGKVRALAVAAPARVPALPDVPTLAELGHPDVQGSAWFAMFAPVGTPPDFIARLNAEAHAALQLPEIRDRMLGLGTLPEGGPPQALGDRMASEVPRWQRLVRERGIKME